ncbi:hypothetical protein B0H13DRAFT_1862376 [Mycena leptocephala]|nr:hypothetical protein B0H13DRAFT_1862376 [Mycena leptocephala]
MDCAYAPVSRIQPALLICAKDHLAHIPTCSTGAQALAAMIPNRIHHTDLPDSTTPPRIHLRAPLPTSTQTRMSMYPGKPGDRASLPQSRPPRNASPRSSSLERITYSSGALRIFTHTRTLLALACIQSTRAPRKRCEPRIQRAILHATSHLLAAFMRTHNRASFNLSGTPSARDPRVDHRTWPSVSDMYALSPSPGRLAPAVLRLHRYAAAGSKYIHGIRMHAGGTRRKDFKLDQRAPPPLIPAVPNTMIHPTEDMRWALNGRLTRAALFKRSKERERKGGRERGKRGNTHAVGRGEEREEKRASGEYELEVAEERCCRAARPHLAPPALASYSHPQAYSSTVDGAPTARRRYTCLFLPPDSQTRTRCFPSLKKCAYALPHHSFPAQNEREKRKRTYLGHRDSSRKLGVEHVSVGLESMEETEGNK